MTATVPNDLSTLDQVPLHRMPVLRPSWQQRLRSTDLWLALTTALFGTVVMLWGITRYPAVGGDEGIYTDQAYAISHGQITSYTYTYDHPFFGWMQLAPLSRLAQWLHLGGQLSVVNTRAVMGLYVFATLLLCFGILRRLDVHRVLAALGVLALAGSSLYIVESRQVFLDTIALPWVLGAFYLCLSPARKQWTYGIAGLLFAVGVLSKETYLLLLPALLYLVWTKAYRPIRSMCLVAFIGLGSLLVAVYPLFAFLRNELFPGSDHVSLWSNGIMYQLVNRGGSGALWEKYSARYNLVEGWLYTDKWFVYAGAAAALITLVSKRTRVLGIAFLLWALPVLKPGGYLPAMYVIAALPFMAMSMAASADLVVRAVRASWQRLGGSTKWTAAVTVGLVVVAALIPAVHDVRNYRQRIDTNVVYAQQQAMAFADKHIPAGVNVLTDDSFWLDLVFAGHGSTHTPWHGAISYYQFDLDPVSSTKNLPHGWQNIGYVIETQPMLQNINNLHLTKVQQTIKHSTVVASYGSGDALTRILRVQPTPYNRPTS